MSNRLDIIQAINRKNECFLVGLKVQHVGIMVHSTGANNPNLRRYCDGSLHRDIGANPYGNHWNQFRPSGKQICAHGFVGRDINGKVRACQTLPFEQNCWLAGRGGKGSVNFAPHSRIQFEICEDNLQNRTYFDEAVMGAAVQWCAEICEQFGWNPLGKDRHGNNIIIDHAQGSKLGIASNHCDISDWMRRFGFVMDDFRRQVKLKMDSTGFPALPNPSEPPPSSGSVYTVVAGDTMSGIAARCGVSLSDLVKANPQIVNVNQIKVGQKLNIPALQTIDRAAETERIAQDIVASRHTNNGQTWGNNPARRTALITYGEALFGSGTGVRFADDVQARVNVLVKQ
jgi:hypothetical protein